jgi:hypothetical protein
MTTPATTEPVVRAHVGYVHHADGTWTFGIHTRDAAGLLTLAEDPVTVMDWDRWAWAVAQTPRALRGEAVEPYIPLPPWAWEEV